MPVDRDGLNSPFSRNVLNVSIAKTHHREMGLTGRSVSK